jgi:hypothetical protein
MEPDPSKPKPTEQRSDDYAEDGVDVTLIRWMLSMTPDERLRTLEENVAALLRLRGEPDR